MNEHPADDEPPYTYTEGPQAEAGEVTLPSPPPAPRRPRGLPIVAGGLAAGVVVLLVAVVWLLSHPPGPPPEAQAATDALRQQVQTLTARLAALEAKPAPEPAPSAPGTVNLAPLEARIAKLEQRPLPTPPDPAPLAALAAKVDALTKAVGAETSKFDALATSTQSAQAALTSSVQASQTALSNQVGASTQHVEALADRVQAYETGNTARVDAAEKHLAAIEQTVTQLSALVARGARADRLSAATTALAAGEKLGDIPGAPPALQRYASVAPPTEASLRLAFPAAATAAEAAATAVPEDSSFTQRIWSNVSQAVTIRDGDHVLVGGSAAPTLERARKLLDAGDLAGAVTALDGLTGPPATAMADWTTEAKNLLAARSALAALTARS